MADRIRLPGSVLFATATVFGVSSTLQGYIALRVLEGNPAPFNWVLRLLCLNLAYWYVPALLAPTILAIALRYRLGVARWPTQIAVHILGALTYSIVHTLVLMAVRALLFSEGRPTTFAALWAFEREEYLRQFEWLLMSYLFLVGVAHALAYRRESETRALAAAHLETRLVEAQLQALQRQLHPHFLFNTLNTIAGLMRTNVNAADSMIDQLGDLLRMTLETSNRQEVSLKQELEILQKYLAIEQTRFGKRLDVTMQVAPETLDARVPSLLLQPLVENAIRHGVAPYARQGRVAIHASRAGGQLVLEVRDSGDGLPPERLTALNRGVGLGNTRARLDHRYPGAYDFAFTNLPEGFSVAVRIPFQAESPSLAFAQAGAA